MSDVFQPGRHPDADQLSVFVEQALPAHEQETTLAHLAVCAECRALVALSLPAEQVAQPAEKPARRVWFHGWYLAWSAAAAVAVLALVVVYVHYVSVTRSNPNRNAEIALAPQPAPIAPQPLPQNQASAPAARNLRQAPAKKSAGAGFGNVAALDQLQQPSADANAPARMQSATGGMGAGSTSFIQKDVLKQSSTMADGRGSKAPSTEAKQQPKPPARPAAPQNQLAAEAGRDQIQGTSAAAGSALSANEPSDRAVLKVASSVHPLPSGLPVFATAERGRQMLALDAAHSLFLSKDAGVHWKAVAVPWKAHAVTVSLVSSAKPAAAQTGNGFGPGFGAEHGGGIGSATGMGKLQAANGMASITGTITDEIGAVIPGTSITVSRAADHVSQTVISDSKGRYVAAGLAPGTYSVEASALGFKTARVSAVTVSTSHENVENFKLSVGTATQTVTVASGPYAERIPLQNPEQAYAPAASPASKSTTAAAPPPVFEITTEDGSRWTSADGVTWKRE
jgi:hypothetical protein